MDLACLSDTPIFSDTKKDVFLDLWIVSSEINQIKADSVQTKAPRGPEINEGEAKKQKKGHCEAERRRLLRIPLEKNIRIGRKKWP